MIEVRRLSYAVRGCQILRCISCEFPRGKITGVIGANGSGKTSLLKHIYRALPSKNAIFLNKDPVEYFSSKEYARLVAVLLQENFQVPADFKVSELIVMGRYAHKGAMEGYDACDETTAGEALRFVDMENFGERSFADLSGGEKQRVLLARALCQETPVLVLDEPANHLDIRHQMSLMEILCRRRRTTIVALHDLNLAAMYCDRLILLHGGELVESGLPAEVLTEANIYRYFGVSSEVTLEAGGRVSIRFARYGSELD